jgi:hypothetical protein
MRRPVGRAGARRITDDPRITNAGSRECADRGVTPISSILAVENLSGHRYNARFESPQALNAPLAVRCADTVRQSELRPDWKKSPMATQSGNHEQRTVLPSVGNVTMDRERSASEEAVDQTAQKLGEAIRSQYDLARPLPDTLNTLVARLDGRDRQTNRLFRRPVAQPSGVTSMEKKVATSSKRRWKPVADLSDGRC